LPAPGQYELGIDGAELRGKGSVDLSALETWIRAQAPRLTPGRTMRGTNVSEGGPPELPFPVRLLRTQPAEGMTDGVLRITWPMDMNALPTRNVEEMKRALERKLPKLEKHRPANGLTLLVLENRDIQLVNPDNV